LQEDAALPGGNSSRFTPAAESDAAGRTPSNAGVVPDGKTANIRALKTRRCRRRDGKKHQPGRNFPVGVGESNR